MQLNSKVKGATTVSPNPIPFYVIGSEQGFLNTAVPRTQITLMPGERIDVLVDFRDVPAGDNQVVMANYNSDGPFQGIDNGAISTVLSVDIPEIMAFDVSNTTDLLFPKATYTTAALRNPAWGAAPLPAAGTTPFPTLLTTNNVRVIGLEEIVDQYGRTMPTSDRRGYAQPGCPATEIVKIMDVEEWDIINTTADAHPMHLHQVAFQIVSRTPFDTVAFFKDNTAAINQVATNVFLQPSYVATGPPIPPGPFENGWKDTAFTPPGFVTKLRAKFDLLGEYVWHCHILSHEEHDMMRPLKVVSLTSNPPTSLTVPAASAIDRTAMVTIVAPAPEAAPGPVTHKYIIEYTQQDSPVLDIWHPVAYFAGQNTLTPTILFPHDGIFALRIKAADATISPIAVDSAWVAGSGLITVTSPTDAITGPAPGALPSSSPTFTITTSNVLYPHTIWVGTTPGGSEIGKFTVAANVLSIPTSNLPTTGIPLYVRLIVSIPPVVVGGLTENRYKDYLYTAANIPNGAVTATTTAATAITSSGFTAHWTVTTGTPTGYFLDVSTSSTFATFLPGFNGRNVGNVTTFALTGLSPATTYYYRVRPHDAVSTGAVSNATTVVRFAKADFNGDIKSDILWRDTASGDVGLWLMNGTNALSKTVVGNVPTNLTWSIAGRSDINGDGKSDILWREAATGNVALWLMNGSTVVSKPLLGNVVSTMTFAATADFNGDGKADILWRDSATGDVTLWLMNGTSVVSSTIVGNVAANLTWAIAGTGDFDGNGHADILWREAATGDVAIWLMNGTAVISKAVVGNVAANLTWSIAATGDFDGDGKSDILLREAATGDVGMWVMNGTTVVSKTIVGNVATNLSWTIAGTGDFNGDGKSEILWRGTVSGDVGMWVMNGTAIVSKTVVGNVPVSWNISN
jgi:predicted nucleotidyltransferase